MPLPLADLPAVLDRDALFTTLLTPRGSTPGTPTYYVSRTPRPTSWERLPARLLNGMLIAASLLLIALVVVTLLPVEKTWRWRKDGCHVQILRLNPSINATLQSARARGDIAPDLGNPLGRRPHAAVLNFVKFHTDVVASLAYHLVKLNHNVTVFVRDDELGMDDVIHPFHWKGFKRWQRFFDHFYEFDVVVLATYPTCHLGTLQALVATGLPQRYIAMVHNPTLLAADGAAAARAAAAGGVQLLTIAPHVNAYANEILQDVGWEQEDARWLAPAFPVLFPEQCSSQLLRSPSGMAAQQPACNRSALWTDAMEPRAAASARASPLTAAPATSKPDTGSTGGSGSRRDGHTKAKEKPASSSSSSRAAPQREPSSRPPARPAPPAALHQRRGFCIQGKLDPARRGYAALFAEMVARRKELLATDLVLVLQGKGGGRFDADILEVPDQLEEEGLVIKFAALPFQEYYELMRSCLGIMAAFASESYFINKGSSTVAASLISGTPLVATPRLLATYTFLDASSVFLVPEGTSDVDAMLAVQALPAERVAAKVAALERLRERLYDRNLEVLQQVLGEAYLFKKNVVVDRGSGATQAVPLWTGVGPPHMLWTPDF